MPETVKVALFADDVSFISSHRNKLVAELQRAVVAAAYQLPRELTGVQPIAPVSFPTSCLPIIVYVRQMLCNVMFMHILAFKDTQSRPIK